MWNYTALPGGQMSLTRWSIHPTFWKVACGVLVLLLLAREYSNHEVRTFRQKHLEVAELDKPTSPVIEIRPDPTAKPVLDSVSNGVTSWEYDWKQDGNNQGLSTSQCDTAFPKLYHEIDRVRERFSEEKITEEDIDMFGGNHGGIRILVVDSQVRIIETRGLHREDFRHRIIAVVQQVVQSVAAADASGEAIPNTEFSVLVDDMPVLNKERPGALWSFTRKHAELLQDRVWLIPDFHFFGAPPEAEGFRTMQAKCRKHDSALEQKIPQVVWRGAMWTNEVVRRPLIEVTAGKEWANVSAMDWSKADTVIPMDEFCKYRYTVNTEGRSWSARMTHLFNCDSLMFVHDVEWVAHYYDLLDTGTNCVAVNRNFHDLRAKIQYYEEHLDEAQQIADRARETFRERYTSPAATACYWRKLMRTWAETVAFEPRIDTAKDGHRMQKTRGITFEEFIVHKNNDDYPYKKKKGG